MAWISRLGYGGCLLLIAGCHSTYAPVYQDKDGFRMTAPPGWVERANESMPERKPRRALPLPALGIPGSSVAEHLRVRYDRLTAGELAWLQVTVADLPATTAFQAWLPLRAPAAGWKREAELEALEVGGLPAARIAFTGRWSNQDYLNESVAVRRDQRVYIITASFPASDQSAREQVRQAVASVSWK